VPFFLRRHPETEFPCKIRADDISQLLILNRKNPNVEPNIFAAELEKFRAHQTRIAATIHHQQGTLGEMTANFKKICESKLGRDIQQKWGKAEKKRKELVSRLTKARDGYLEVRTSLA
jgi:tyrosine-protein phosphatase non-receptor type 23